MISYPEIDPVLLDLGRLKVRWYGMMYLISFVLGWLLARWRAGRPDSGWKVEQVDDLVTYCVVGLIVGGRFGYTLFYDFSYFLTDPVEIFKIWKGGMSFHGGVIGLTLAVILFARNHKKRISQVGDFLVPVAPQGLFFGRLGNFINGELWGRVTDAPWGMVFPHPAAGDQPRHPSQLYEAFLEGLVLFTVLWWFSSRKRPPWAVTGLFFLGYGVARFMVEFVREPDAHIGFIAFGWMSMGQALCVPMIVGGLLMLAWAYLHRHPEADTASSS